MSATGGERRDISNNQFSPNTNIYQGNVNLYMPHRPARCEVEGVRVIPYPRNEDLVHRQDLINKLDELLPQSPGFYSAALWGLGGSGKTQIALNYAYQRCDDSKCCVFWVHADNEATFTTDYKMIGDKLGVDERLDGPDLLDAVRSSIEAQSRWVLILDNADNLELFGVGCTEGESLFKYIPQGSQGTILWTSRDAHIRGTLVGPSRDIKVPPMTKGEATTLLTAASGDELAVKDARLDQLLEELQRLPLAVSQAGAYIRRTSMTVKEYLDLLILGSSRWDLLKINDFDRHRRPEVSNSVLETWKISTARIRDESELSYRILHVIAYLDGQDIPHELIVAASRYDAGDEVPEIEVQRAVMRLMEFSFLDMRRGEGGLRSYEMHKLVQEAVRYGLWTQGQMDMASSNITTGENRTESEEAYYSGITLQIVDAMFPLPEKNSWPQCEKYVTHAIRAGEWAEVSGKKAEASALLSRASQFLYDRGRWREREPVDRRTMDLCMEVLGESHPDTIDSIAELGTTYYGQGRYNEAEAIYKRVLDLQQEVLGEKHPKTINTMANLASIYSSQGRYNKSGEIKRQVLDLRRELFGEKDPKTIDTIASLAITYGSQGQYGKAEEMQKQVLDFQREVLGEKHPDTIRSISNYAATYYRQGRFNEAEGIYKQVLDLRQEVLGEGHPDTIKGMADLAITYKAQGQYNEAERIGKQALNLQREVLGEEHPNTIRIMMDLAVTYYRQGRLDEAERIGEKAMNLQRKALGEKHPDTLWSMFNLARIYYKQCRYDEAEGIYEQVTELRREVLGEGHPDTIASIATLEEVHNAQGQHHKPKSGRRTLREVLHTKLEIFKR